MTAGTDPRLRVMRSASPQAGVDLLQRGRAGAQLLLGECVERPVHRVEMKVQILGLVVDEEKAGQNKPSNL